MFARFVSPAGIMSFALTLLATAMAAPAKAAEPARPASPAPSPAASPSPSPGPTLRWRSIGPPVSGGRVATVAGTDLDPNLFYAGAAGGGVWRSTNGGPDWTPVFDDAGTQSIGAIAIAPHDKNDVWVGTGEPWLRNDVIPGDGVYHSTDGGKTWTHLGLEQTSQIARVLLDPRDPKRVLVAALGDPFRDSAERGVFRSDRRRRDVDEDAVHRPGSRRVRPRDRSRRTPTSCTPACGASGARPGTSRAAATTTASTSRPTAARRGNA